MSIDEKVVEATNEEVATVQSYSSIEDAVKEIARLKSISKEVIDTRDKVKDKLKKLEVEKADWLKTATDVAKSLEESNLQKDNVAKELKSTKVTHALEKALVEAGIAALPTAMKLLDVNSIDVEKVVAVVLTHTDGDHVAALPLFKNAKIKWIYFRKIR